MWCGYPSGFTAFTAPAQSRCQAAGGRAFPSGRHGGALAPSVHSQAEPRGPVAAALSGDGCCGWHPCGPHVVSALPDDRACSRSDGAGNISAKEAWVRAPKPPSRRPPRLKLLHTFERMTAGCRSQPAQPPHRRQRALRSARGPSVVDADTKPRIATSHATDLPITRAQAHESCTKLSARRSKAVHLRSGESSPGHWPVRGRG
jgi:hypothetical protein